MQILERQKSLVMLGDIKGSMRGKMQTLKEKAKTEALKSNY